MSMKMSQHSSRSFANGSCLRTGIPESDTGDSGEESEPTYRHYDNFETDVCLTQDEDEEPLGSSSPVIKVKEIGARLKSVTPPEPPRKDVIIREGREPIPRDDFTLPANNRNVSSDTDTETEQAKLNGGTDGTITTSTSESEETQIWVPVSKRPSARNGQDNTTPTGSSNGSDGSRPQSLGHKPGTSGQGHNFSTGSLTFVTSQPSTQFDRASITTGTLEERRGSKDSWQTFKNRMKKSASPPKHLSLGLLRHDDRTGTITLDIRNMQPNSESGLGQFQSENEQFTSENEAGAAKLSRYGTDEIPNSFTDNLCVTCSLIYMLLITVTGLLIPIAELFVSKSTPAIFEGFYVYLHVVSILFLVYVYAYVLGIRTSLFRRGDRPIVSPLARGRNHVTDRGDTQQHTGSFYLRIGVVGFGIGSMIKCGLHFGEFFGVMSSSYCSHVLYAIRPVLHLCFTFIQLYFVFLSSNMLIHQYKRIARFGLMHMIATNMCVWFENVVNETLRELSLTNSTGQLNSSFGQEIVKNSFHAHPEADCLDDSLMSEVVNTSFPYLFPCIVLYSLICTSILYTMWSRLDANSKRLQTKNRDSFRRSRSSVDCSGSSKGLFLGIIIFVAIVIILITQFVLNRAEGFQTIAIQLEHIGDIVIFTITTIAVCLAFNRSDGLRRNRDQQNSFEEMLLVLSLIGVYGFCVANIIAGANTSASDGGRLIITSNCVHLIQASVQTVFLLGNVHKHTAKREHQNEKPGREFVTFLLVCNVAIFVMGLFKVQQANVNLVQTRFYGSVTWNVITHVTVPITIFFRFQSSVCLANIWKYAWRPTQGGD